MIKIFLVFLAIFSISCTDAEWSNYETLGKTANIKLYGCDGKLIGEWESTGKVITERNSDGYIFKDAKTKRFIRITGTIVIEN